MSDQAQGLRALADQIRGDHNGTAVAPQPSPDSLQAVLPIRIQAPAQAATDGLAVVDTRLHRSRQASQPRPAGRVLAITSGKGGVGKSVFAVNLAITLGALGQRVIVLDADTGLANVHLLAGASPRFCLEHVVQGSKSFQECLHEIAPNVSLLAGGAGVADVAGLDSESRELFLNGLRELCDILIVDTGAGLASTVVSFLSAVNEVIVLATPEQTAITDAYVTVKVLSQQNPSARMMLVVNMVNSSGEGAAVGDKLRSIASQFLHRHLEYLGCIPSDSAVPKAVRLRRPFVCSAPGCAAAAGINQIIRKLGYRSSASAPQAGVDGFITLIQRVFRVQDAV